MNELIIYANEKRDDDFKFKTEHFDVIRLKRPLSVHIDWEPCFADVPEKYKNLSNLRLTDNYGDTWNQKHKIPFSLYLSMDLPELSNYYWEQKRYRYDILTKTGTFVFPWRKSEPTSKPPDEILEYLDQNIDIFDHLPLIF